MSKKEQTFWPTFTYCIATQFSCLRNRAVLLFPKNDKGAALQNIAIYRHTVRNMQSYSQLNRNQLI